MKKFILVLMLLSMIPTNCEKITSQNFWKEQQITTIIPGKRTILAQALAAISCFGVAAYLADKMDREDQAAQRRPFSNEPSLKGVACLVSIITGGTFYVKTFTDLALICLQRSALKLQTRLQSLSKDLNKLGIEKEAASQLAYFLLCYSETLCAKQIVTEKLKEHLSDESHISYILEKFFGDNKPKGSKAFPDGSVKVQNIRNIQFYYQLFPWEAEYVVEKYYKLSTKEITSPLASKVMQLKLQKKFPNHPVLELFS